MDERFASLPGRLLPWYAAHHRDLPWRRDREPYHVWLSEIMLQQTRVEAVKSYYTRFLQALPDISSLAAADDDQLHKLWEGLGYYTRVRNLKRAAQVILSEYDGVFPSTHAQILQLPGIGAYTAGAIASICFGQPTPAVDGNVLRVTTRLTANDAPIDTPAVKKEITQSLAAIYPADACGDFTQSLMELGATICAPNGAPDCLNCPLQDLCAAHLSSRETAYPVKSVKRPRRIENRTVFLLRCADTVALHRRPAKGLLAGLWELPNCSEHLTAQQALETASAFDVHPLELVKSVDHTHIFTHIEWHMRCFEIRCQAASSRFVWVASDALASQYALPTAFRIFL